MTKTPYASGSDRVRAISSRISSRPFAHGSEVRLHVLVRHELDEEAHVVRPRTANRDRHAADSWTRTPKKR